MSVTHTKVSAKSDPADTTLVRPSDWNAAHTIANGSITAAMMAVPPAYTTYVAPGGAAGDIQAAMDAMPAGGGVIQLAGNGSQYNSVPLVFPSATRNLLIQGQGGIGEGGAVPTQINFGSSGSGSHITVPVVDRKGCGFRDVGLAYTNAAFTGTLLDLKNGTFADNSHFILDNVGLAGVAAAGQTATLLDLTQTVNTQLNRVAFTGGGIQVRGGRSVAVTGVSIANPSIITAPGHGYLTGAAVHFGGLSTTPALPTGPTYTTATVIDANTFSVPFNVTAVADGVGFVNNLLVDQSNANPVLFQSCFFRSAAIAPIKDAAEAWAFDSCFFSVNIAGEGTIYTHTPGHWAKGLTFRNCWQGDLTATNAQSLITWAGWGLNLVGNRLAGRSDAHVTVLTLDENNCDGYVGSGNVFANTYQDINFGTTTGHTQGVWMGNAHYNETSGSTRFVGTIPKGVVFYNVGGTTANSAIFTGVAGVTIAGTVTGGTLAQLQTSYKALLVQLAANGLITDGTT